MYAAHSGVECVVTEKCQLCTGLVIVAYLVGSWVQTVAALCFPCLRPDIAAGLCMPHTAHGEVRITMGIIVVSLVLMTSC
jgi:hypothetical protein